MNPYLKQRCACCKGYFAGDEDIVTCPDCGAPVHRICWEKLGHCPYADKHGTGFEWKPEIPKQKTDTPPYFPPDPDNGPDTVFTDENHTASDRTDQTHSQNTDFFGQEENLEKWFKEQEDNFYRNSDANTEKKFMGVSEMELNRFLCPYPGKGAYTANLLKTMALTGKKASLNVFALFLTPIYQFYRRMYLPAILLTFAYVLLSIPQMLFILGNFYGSEAASAMLSNPSYLALNTIFYYISIALSIIMGIFGDRLYLNWAVKKIKSIRENFDDDTSEEYYSALSRAGNPGIRFGLLGLVVLAVISYVVVQVVFSPLM